MTCHNRREKTLACLDALFGSDPLIDATLEVYLVDDGSKDGTSEAIKARYPTVNIIAGDGNLFWNGGMRVAFAAALKKGFDYYLWLNDDTILYPQAISVLLCTARQIKLNGNPSAVVVGSTQDEQSGKTTYGGERRISKWRPIKYELVIPKDVPIPCDTMNGNCVFIPSEITQVLGNLDKDFTHTIGDIDYGLRAKLAGFGVVVMPGYAGLCSRNSINNSFADPHLSVRERLSKILGKKGLPWHAWYVFTKRHCGTFWFVFWMWTYLKIVLTPRQLNKNAKWSLK